MYLKIIRVFLVFFLCVSITACSNNKGTFILDNSNSTNDSSIADASVQANISPNPVNTPSDSEVESTNIPILSESKMSTLSTDRIHSILSSQNRNVIESLGLSDSDKIKTINNGERFYVPVFKCEQLGVLIGFNGAHFDSIDTIKENDDTPIFIKPSNGTIITFDNDMSFCVGDDMKKFKIKFGEGHASIEGNLQGDKEYRFLTYDINNLTVSFRSLDGDDFSKYDVHITKSPSSSNNNISNDNKKYDDLTISKINIDEAIKIFIEKNGLKNIEFDGIEDETNYYIISWTNPSGGMGAVYYIDPTNGNVYDWERKLLLNLFK